MILHCWILRNRNSCAVSAARVELQPKLIKFSDAGGHVSAKFKGYFFCGIASRESKERKQTPARVHCCTVSREQRCSLSSKQLMSLSGCAAVSAAGLLEHTVAACAE